MSRDHLETIIAINSVNEEKIVQDITSAIKSKKQIRVLINIEDKITPPKTPLSTITDVMKILENNIKDGDKKLVTGLDITFNGPIGSHSAFVHLTTPIKKFTIIELGLHGNTATDNKFNLSKCMLSFLGKGGLKSLKSLDLSNTHNIAKSILDISTSDQNGLFLSLRTLDTLNLYNSGIDDTNIDRLLLLPRTPNQNRLTVHGNTAQGLSTLILTDNHITPAGIAKIENTITKEQFKCAINFKSQQSPDTMPLSHDEAARILMNLQQNHDDKQLATHTIVNSEQSPIQPSNINTKKRKEPPATSPEEPSNSRLQQQSSKKPARQQIF
jgi:hypothetical protein